MTGHVTKAIHCEYLRGALQGKMDHINTIHTKTGPHYSKRNEFQGKGLPYLPKILYVSIILCILYVFWYDK